MLFLLQIHRNIFSSQCYIRCINDSNSFNIIQVKCFSSGLALLLLMNDEVVKKVKVITPNDFFIPSSLSTDSESSLISGSTILSRVVLTPAGQSVVECSFRLQISRTDKLDQSESELKIDVKDFFKRRFKNGTHWDLFCASCGVGLAVKPVFIGSVREYSESELADGWFCHGNGPQPALNPSSQILYMDDISFYLYPRPDINSDITTVLDEKCCNIDCTKDGSICAPRTNCSIKSCGDCSDSENTGQLINSLDSATDSSITSDFNSSSVKQTDSSVRSSICHACDCRPSGIYIKENLSGTKVLNSTVKCQSCGDVLTAEKSPIPFVKFYLDKLMFKNSSFNDDHLEYTHNIALLSFWSLVTKAQTSLLPCKLFLESKVRSEELCLLLWVPSAPVAQFLLRDSLETLPPEVHLRTEPVYKVLYFVGTSLSENVRSWRHDFSVDFYHVSDTMVKTLVRILDASSSHLPETSAAGGFSCGFLRAPTDLLR